MNTRKRIILYTNRKQELKFTAKLRALKCYKQHEIPINKILYIQWYDFETLLRKRYLLTNARSILSNEVTTKRLLANREIKVFRLLWLRYELREVQRNSSKSAHSLERINLNRTCLFVTTSHYCQCQGEDAGNNEKELKKKKEENS